MERVLNGEELREIDKYDNNVRCVSITLAEYRELCSIRGEHSARLSAHYEETRAWESERKAREQLVEALRAQVEEMAAQISTLEKANREMHDFMFGDAMSEISGSAEEKQDEEDEAW